MYAYIYLFVFIYLFIYACIYMFVCIYVTRPYITNTNPNTNTNTTPSGTNLASQRIIETVRKDPIGWGEISKNLLVNMPPVPEKKADSHKGEL